MDLFIDVKCFHNRTEMAKLFAGSRKKVQVSVECPQCKKPFKVEYEPKMGGSYYHAITEDGKKVLSISAVHTKNSRGLRCPYCEAKFVSEGNW